VGHEGFRLPLQVSETEVELPLYFDRHVHPTAAFCAGTSGDA
jgi:hypothetical protein